MVSALNACGRVPFAFTQATFQKASITLLMETISVMFESRRNKELRTTPGLIFSQKATAEELGRLRDSARKASTIAE